MFTTRVLSAYQRARLTAFLDPSADPEGIGYQTRQVRVAISQGGWFGQGLFAGPQTQGGAIPFQQTDFVFSVAGEEWGFLGAAGLVVLDRVPHPAHPAGGRRAATRSGSWSASGVAVWFAVQAFENIGMNLGIMPVTGLPLPFLSYGGSSMFAAWLALGPGQQRPPGRSGPPPLTRYVWVRVRPRRPRRGPSRRGCRAGSGLSGWSPCSGATPARPGGWGRGREPAAPEPSPGAAPGRAAGSATRRRRGPPARCASSAAQNETRGGPPTGPNSRVSHLRGRRSRPGAEANTSPTRSAGVTEGLPGQPVTERHEDVGDVDADRGQLDVLGVRPVGCRPTGGASEASTWPDATASIPSGGSSSTRLSSRSYSSAATRDRAGATSPRTAVENAASRSRPPTTDPGRVEVGLDLLHPVQEVGTLVGQALAVVGEQVTPGRSAPARPTRSAAPAS